jgi:signal transduction histidine kinase
VDDERARRREVNDVMRHDMRTRVGIGKGYITMLLAHYDRMTPDQRAAALRGIDDAFDRLDEFSRRVLMDEKLEVVGPVAQRGEVPVASLLGPVAAAYPEVVVETAPGVPETAYVDPVMVRELLDNLLANAVTAAPAGTPVTLRLSGALRIEVHDAGTSITEEDVPLLFERYGRTAHSRAAQSPGLGLGLSIVRRLVEAHEGTYGVRLGEGTTFWVDLPVAG